MRDLLAIHSLSTRGLSLGLIASAAMTIPAVSVAAPLILAEPTAKVPIPDARFDSVGDVAIDGDFMIMGVDHDYFPGPYEWWRTSAAYLFRRQDSRTWAPVRKLAETNLSVWDDDVPPMQVAMRNGIAAMTWYGQQLLAFERSGADWVSAPVNLNQLGIQGTELEIDGGTILASADTCGNGGFAFRKDATGSYVPVQRYDGAYRGCDAEQLGGDVDISGSIVVIPQQYGEDGSTPPVLYIWEGIPTSAPPTLLGQGGAASIQGDTLAEGGIYNNVSGTQIYRRQSAGVWSHEQTIAMPDGLQTTFLPADLQMEDGFLMQGRNGNVEMFQRDSTGQFKYVAKLLDAGKAHITQRRVVTHGSDGAVKVYELPASLSQPELKQDDFQDADANGWEPQAGSSYAVVSTPYSYAYRQSSLMGNAMSLLTNIDWKNQSIQADVKPTAFDGNDRWFGLIGRYIDPNNYYYVTVRNSNSVQLRKMVNGVFQSLGSAPLSVAVNRNYNVRFEAIGSLLRVYVDDVLALEANDSTHSHGRVGLMTYKTRADFDNVIVDSQQSTTLLADDFGVCNRRIWTVQGEGNWLDPCDTYAQTSTAGTARTLTGVETTHQNVKVKAIATAFNGSDRWLGVMARYVDPNNYYYLTIRSNNSVSLRRLKDGVITILDSAPLTVALGTQYALRLEVIGSSLRGYVNGALMLEAKDATFAKGKYGLVTYKTAARFDDFLATQP